MITVLPFKVSNGIQLSAGIHIWFEIICLFTFLISLHAFNKILVLTIHSSL